MPDKTKTIIVNATALSSGGALTILEIFLDEIKNTKQNYFIFVALHLQDCFYKKSNIKIFGVNTSSILKRIHWDWLGLSQWVKVNNILPDIVLSLQNTSINLKNTRQFIYLHQAIVLHPAKWSLFKKGERKLALYKYIYPFFIKYFLRHDTTFLVQTNWMKRECKRRFKTSNVKILPPNLSNFNIENIKKINLTFKYNLFYPANGSVFKNHIEVIKALYEIKKNNPELSIGLYLTISKQENINLTKLIVKYNLMKNVIFLGTISKETTKRFYKSCTALVFPSYIESFGLPLLEVQKFHKPIIVADEPYAREVLKDYALVLYTKLGATKDWQQNILEVIKLNHRDLDSFIHSDVYSENSLHSSAAAEQILFESVLLENVDGNSDAVR